VLPIKPEDTKMYARNQYQGTLELMSLDALIKLAFQEYKIKGSPNESKTDLIQKILDQKYGED
jgi:hypothetical protein